MVNLIKACENEGALELLEESFVLTEEQKRSDEATTSLISFVEFIPSNTNMEEKIHKLPLGVPRAIKAIVADFYHNVKQSSESTLEYKGGHYERSLEFQQSIWENFGCPKAKHLFDALVWLETCGNHTELNAYHHCAKVEVEAFGHWLSTLKA